MRIKLRQQRLTLFEYIVRFLHQSTLQADLLQPIGKGANLAKRPFLATNRIRSTRCPSWYIPLWRTIPFGIPTSRIKDWHWLGCHAIAIDQLLNFVDVYDTYGRVPNALTTEFLSHSQPPLDGFSAYDLLTHGAEPGQWFHDVMQMLERELYTEWWDYGQRINPRQSDELTARFGKYLTRYTSVHFHPLLVGCQDGKDHHLISVKHGEHYLPAQLNALIYGNLGLLEDYYTQHQPDDAKAQTYRELKREAKAAFNRHLWVKSGAWRGFRNYDLKAGEVIEFYDLGAELWPLFVKLATEEQAITSLKNVNLHYLGDIGLATTGPTPSQLEEMKSYEEVGWELQWDVNAWPPLMMMSVDALLNYQHVDPSFQLTAEKLMIQWVAWQETLFERRGVMYEKAPYATFQATKTGYYGNLVGFGWTIASYLKFTHYLASAGLLEEANEPQRRETYQNYIERNII